MSSFSSCRLSVSWLFIRLSVPASVCLLRADGHTHWVSTSGQGLGVCPASAHAVVPVYVLFCPCLVLSMSCLYIRLSVPATVCVYTSGQRTWCMSSFFSRRLSVTVCVLFGYSSVRVMLVLLCVIYAAEYIHRLCYRPGSADRSLNDAMSGYVSSVSGVSLFVYPSVCACLCLSAAC